MYYYLVPRIGSGTNDDPYRPDVPAGVDYVCQDGIYNKFLVATKTIVPSMQSLSVSPGLQNACYNNRISYSDVRLIWYLP